MVFEGPKNTSARETAISYQDMRLMQMALELAESCHNVPYYGVGCVIALNGNVVATGFTGEVYHENSETMMHAEEVAIGKAKARGIALSGAAIYSTMEPCSERKSGKPSCTLLIIENGIHRVLFGTKEPYDQELGIVCEGENLLRAAGILVIQVADLAEECLRSVLSKRLEDFRR